MSLKRPLLTKLIMPVSKGKTFQRPKSVFTEQTRKLNLELRVKSISGDPIGFWGLLAFSECGPGMLYPAMSYLVPHRESPSLWNASSISWQETAVHLYEDNLRSLLTQWWARWGGHKGECSSLGPLAARSPLLAPGLKRQKGYWNWKERSM